MDTASLGSEHQQQPGAVQATPNGDGGQPPVAGQPTAQSADGTMTAMNLMRLVDLRGLAKLTAFSGAEEDWPEWKFRMRSLAPLLGLQRIFERAES